MQDPESLPEGESQKDSGLTLSNAGMQVEQGSTSLEFLGPRILDIVYWLEHEM